MFIYTRQRRIINIKNRLRATLSEYYACVCTRVKNRGAPKASGYLTGQEQSRASKGFKGRLILLRGRPLREMLATGG
ncbi:hypothetical protein NDU88_001978 [Pleurodeles waltl]|uniref:Uncharacterized protein n=1 Tax=Pleurodeles waltl TaxID=8319 RepID=A0AAV7R9J4_PLEWA|nr:hypothetical protein NDU88_001978 [Pleurodeles waltl]